MELTKEEFIHLARLVRVDINKTKIRNPSFGILNSLLKKVNIAMKEEPASIIKAPHNKLYAISKPISQTHGHGHFETIQCICPMDSFKQVFDFHPVFLNKPAALQYIKEKKDSVKLSVSELSISQT